MARVNREFCMLAEKYKKDRDRIAGMYLSEKLDGMRAIWLPKTRGIPISQIPFANRAKDIRDTTSTGLWSKYGKVIMAPEWFLQGFPDHPLDGELWIGYQKFQETMSVVRSYTAGVGWKNVKMYVLDAPRYFQILASGKINNPQFKKEISWEDNVEYLKLPYEGPAFNFDTTYKWLQFNLLQTQYLKLHEQLITPFATVPATAMLETMMTRVIEAGGEGVMIRHPAHHWEPIRNRHILKAKPLHDAEGVVTGYRAGQGKYAGMLGSLTVSFQGKSFELSGFTDDERQISFTAYQDGEMLSNETTISKHFPLGSLVTFKYRELSDDGIPKEARYFRKAIKD